MARPRRRVQHVGREQTHGTGSRIDIRPDPEAPVTQIRVNLAIADSNPPLERVFGRDPEYSLATARWTLVDESVGDIRRVTIAVVVDDGDELQPIGGAWFGGRAPDTELMLRPWKDSRS